MRTATKPNLILISLDTLRADVAYNAGLPNLDRLRQRGTVFRNTVSSAPLTPVSHASILTGLQPFEHGVRHLFKESLQTCAPTLAELTLAAGYRTGAVVSCPGMKRWYGFDRGFDHYDDEIPLLADGSDPLLTVDVRLRGTALKRAPIVVERGLEWLDANRHEAFFLFMHFFDTHWPYEPPEWFAPEGRNAYEGEAFFVDHYLGRFFQRLDDWGLVDNSLVVVFSDHGEDLNGWYANDRGGPEGDHPEEDGHGCLLFDATQMVPLIIIGESFSAGLTVEEQVRLVDILPTVVEALGLSDTAARSGIPLDRLLDGRLSEAEKTRHSCAYMETYYREEQATSDRGVRGLTPWKGYRVDNRLKILFDVGSGASAAYNLLEDPLERRPFLCNEFGVPNHS